MLSLNKLRCLYDRLTERQAMMIGGAVMLGLGWMMGRVY